MLRVDSSVLGRCRFGAVQRPVDRLECNLGRLGACHRRKRTIWNADLVGDNPPDICRESLDLGYHRDKGERE